MCIELEAHNYAWETGMLGLLPKMMMGLPLKLLFVVSAVFTVIDTKAEHKGRKQKKTFTKTPWRGYIQMREKRPIYINGANGKHPIKKQTRHNSF